MDPQPRDAWLRGLVANPRTPFEALPALVEHPDVAGIVARRPDLPAELGARSRTARLVGRNGVLFLWFDG
jgi:hypothetical protein